MVNKHPECAHKRLPTNEHLSLSNVISFVCFEEYPGQMLPYNKSQWGRRLQNDKKATQKWCIHLMHDIINILRPYDSNPAGKKHTLNQPKHILWSYLVSQPG